ncbi:MAG TPA: twin-arginine translocase subunit TatC [Flavitalea sp.]|nr:twin-arginine translocase subunit TatC [Flavitalea sp.]
MALSLFNRRKPDQPEMTFIDHLEELRWHIVRALIAIIIAAVFIFIKLDWIFDHVILGPIQNDFVSYKGLCNFSHWLGIGDALCMPPIPPGYKLLGNTVSGPFMSAIQIGLMGGLILAFPYVFYEFWRFIKPALSPTELKYSRNSIFWVSFCFFLGAAFGYFILGPFTFNFLANFTLGTTNMYEYKPALGDYLDSLLDLMLGCAIAFELPILTYVLTKIGLVTPSFLKTYRKYAFLVILIVAAVITPSPDWTSQLIVTLPLVLLYELSIFISARVYKRDAEWH